MDATLHALGRILLNAIPTFLLLLFLLVYLKQMFFKPLARTLEARFAATEGAQRAAAESLKLAEFQVEQYRRALQAARAESYREQERVFKEVAAQNAGAAEAGRKAAEGRITEAKRLMEVEVEAAKQTLGMQSQDLADRIASAILQGQPA